MTLTYDLVGDIGGTNTRLAFAASNDSAFQNVQVYPNAEFKSLLDIIEFHIQHNQKKPQRACLAVAGPPLEDFVKLTNCPWGFSQKELQQTLSLKKLRVVNDFTAFARSLSLLQPKQIQRYGGTHPTEIGPRAVLGPGTGLGVSGLLQQGNEWIPLQGEGGNVSLPISQDWELELFSYLKSLGFEFVYAETILSGDGLVRLAQFLQQKYKWKSEFTSAKKITDALLLSIQSSNNINVPEFKDWGTIADEGLQAQIIANAFIGILATMASDVALTLGATGGVYIGGGILPRWESFLNKSCLRERFENKGRYRPYIQRIPLYLIKDSLNAPLMGALSLCRE